jgi:hypothetical protein
MRTFEALGSRRKLVTTNAALREYDFFNPVNITVIDRRRPQLDREFLHTPYEPVKESIRQKYSLSHWVREVCDLGAV